MRSASRRCNAALVSSARSQIIHSLSAIDLCSSFKQWGRHSHSPEALRSNIGVSLSALQACSKLKDSEIGRKIHSDAAQGEIDANIFVANTLISTYAKCRLMEEAAKVFHGIQTRSVVSWNALMLGYAENGEEELALELFSRIQREGPGPNARTFAAAGKACSGLAVKEAGRKIGTKVLKVAALEVGRGIHAQAAKVGCDSEVFVASTFIDMFAKCGSMVDSDGVFSKALQRDEVCWNALMLGYIDNGEERRALELFSRMEAGGCRPNARSFVGALKACSALAKKEEEQEALQIGMAIHARASKLGYENEGFVASTLVDMYIKCGSLRHARLVFDMVSSHCPVSWNSLMLGYVENKDEEQALDLFSRMSTVGHVRDGRSFVAALKASSGLAGKEGGKQVQGKLVRVCSLEKVMGIHTQAQKAGCDTDIFVASALVDAYAKCVSMEDARKVFDTMPLHTVVSWTALILGYAENDSENLALDLFSRMPSQGCPPNVWTFVAALKACSGRAAKEKADGKCVKTATLDAVMDIHSRTKNGGMDSDIILLGALVDAYVKCGSMDNAREVFNGMHKQDTVVWNSLILGYVDNGEEATALELFASVAENCRDSRTYVAALKACSFLALKEEPRQQDGTAGKALERAMSIHLEAANAGFELDVFLATTLIDTYAKCGSMKDSRRVYDKLPAHNAALWTALLLGYVENWEEAAVLDLLDTMPAEGDAQTFVAALKACANLAVKEEVTKEVDGRLVKARALEKGSAIHRQASKCEMDSDVFVANTLVDMYVKCWNLVDAWRVFNGMENRNVVAWNSLLLGYTKAGEEGLALELISSMQFSPDVRTYSAGLKACTALAAKETGTQVDGKLYKLESLDKALALHRQSAELGCGSDVFLASSLIECYAKCGSLVDSLRVFEKTPRYNVLSLNALMLGYVENGEEKMALELLAAALEGCKPNAQTFIAALKACTAQAAKEEGKPVDGKLVKVDSLDKGKAIHSAVVENGYGSVGVITGTLVNMYAKCRSLTDARKVFDSIAASDRDVVLWNTLLLGYVENCEEKLALEAFSAMRARGSCQPDAGTFIPVLKACGNMASMDAAREIFAVMVRYGAENFHTVANSVVDVLGKCGSMIHAQLVFDALATRDTVTWNCLIAGYSHQSSIAMVFSSFHQMRDENLEVNGVTLVSLLTACSHAGLWDKARRYLDAMPRVYGIPAGMEHYHCVVDALGRANQLDAAVAMVHTMSLPPTALTWFTILSACQKWGDVERASLVMRSLLVAPGSSDVVESAYVLLGKLTGR
ncbi:pentatricopeptide repeat-containing protein At3g09040, mitochondrial-like [Selaginella moellendorffii]|uniref:pentatricopeptide repeat-containing protein At3g09040, mitochondrial-like n=1 Tax=Selaginella moellendorffii TaxID=88036 RepID=UPI000D1CA524|nr:pentatricopeptide repeat-containing protein At3g09040, mitochondrial-like [Selaginella moellendorffii]|eukprot:XP_024541853.1 pentatricopeptide repeat-containing protein At3g09040, mitochondrial-like [Selaginella moellendorffii]